MKLNTDSINWAIKNLYLHNDTDIFPKLREIATVNSTPSIVVDYLSNIDIGAYKWKENRRFIIPKSENSYRIATQLNLLDNIMLTSIIYEFGQKIEDGRIPTSEKTVFSYRFAPQNNTSLYDNRIGWKNFWETCRIKGLNHKYAIYLDISDFYNQIYHHTIEQQLEECGLDKEIVKSLISFLGNITKKVSRGIPIGPHTVHLLAELSMIPIDKSLRDRRIDFCRFSDDIIIFTDDIIDSKIIIYRIADILDKQQRLVLQQQKTKIYEKSEFIEYCNSNLNNKSINSEENEIISVLNRYSDNPYETLTFGSFSNQEKALFSHDKVTKIVTDALSEKYVNYSKLRWFYRRLSQVGTENAVEATLSNFDKLLPALNDIMLYFLSISQFEPSICVQMGEELLKLLENKLISSNEFFLITILNIFGSSKEFNHIDKLISKYDSVSENLRREILFATIPAKASSWIRELREHYPNMNTWCKRSYLMACSIIPQEEKQYFLKNERQQLGNEDVIEKSIIKWALENN